MKRFLISFALAVTCLLIVLCLSPAVGPASAEVGAEEFNSAPGRFNSIKADDVDRDGKIEIVYGDYDGWVTMLEHNKGDFFVDWKYEVGGNRVWGVELGDVTGDNKLDIVVGNGMGKIFVFDGESKELTWKYEGDGRDAHGLLLHDFNGDNINDIAVGTQFKNDDPNGMFYIVEYGADEPFFMTKKTNSRWRGIDVGDVDNDGVEEVVVGSGAALGDVAGEGYVRVYNITLSEHENPLKAEPEWTSEDLGGCVQGLALRDVDNDGTLNIVLSNGYRYRDGWIYIFQYNEDKERYEEQWKSENVGPKPYGFLCEDIDNDDVYEIVVGNQPGYIYIYDGFQKKLEWKSELLGTDVMGLCAVDLDSDPQLELIAAQGGYQGKGDYTSGYTTPHIYVIDGKTHKVEITLGERDNVKLVLQIILIGLIILFLIEVSLVTKILATNRRKKK